MSSMRFGIYAQKYLARLTIKLEVWLRNESSVNRLTIGYLAIGSVAHLRYFENRAAVSDER